MQRLSVEKIDEVEDQAVLLAREEASAAPDALRVEARRARRSRHRDARDARVVEALGEDAHVREHVRHAAPEIVQGLARASLESAP